jgi:hypothetical protein
MVKNKSFLLNSTALSITAMAFGAAFDAFSHMSVGFDTFYSLPHLFIYGGVILSIICAAEGFKANPSRLWRLLLATLCCVPLAGALDFIWHRFNSVEAVGSVWIVWSLPHLLLFLPASMAALILAFLIQSENRFKSKKIVAPLMVGVSLAVLMIPLGPFLPLGPFHVLGSAGIGFTAFAVVFYFLLSRRMFPDTPAALLTSMVGVILAAVIYDSSYYAAGPISFFHTPVWLILLMYALPALVIDKLMGKLDYIFLGALAGLVYSLTFFALAGLLAPGNNLIYLDLWLGGFCGFIGGLLAGLTHHLLKPPATEEN